MTARRLFAVSAFAFALACASSSFAQVKKEQVAGTWLLVAYETTGADGSKRPVFSAKPQGTLMLDAGGRYAMILVNPERAKKWSGKSRDDINADDLASAARGLVAQFGTWAVEDGGKTLVRNIVGALNPTNAGVSQRIQISVSGDELRLVDPKSGVAGGRTEQVFRRAK